MNVPKLTRIGPANPQPHEDVVATVRELLVLAESGELRGIAYIGYLTDRNIKWGNVGPEMAATRMRTYGLLHWLAGKIMQAWDGDNE